MDIQGKSQAQYQSISIGINKTAAGSPCERVCLADYVTQVDIAVQDFSKKELFAPGAGYSIPLGRNRLQEIKCRQLGFLDPVDGTTNLMYIISEQRCIVSPCCQGEIITGIVCFIPSMNSVFAMKGKGSFRMGQPIHTAR